ncbi:MAG TPA: formate dehydrogenase accessory protein FdhE [Gemmataceae bacterium]|nr:formate dehydrogenase accessory protein FdhE [Gemmataceae bacterium]
MLPQASEATLELARLIEKRPTLRAHGELLTQLLHVLFDEPCRESLPALPLEKARAKLEGGIPLLRGEELRLDESMFRARWAAVCAAFERHQDAESLRALATALQQNRLSPRELLGDVLGGRPEEIHRRAELLTLDPLLTATVLRLTLFPVLSRWAVALAPLRQGIRWEHGFCPTCGSWPLLGEFRGLEQLRFLRCGLCASAWEFPRLQCPFCGERDHRQLGYLHAEGEEASRRACTCDTCRSYVKMVATLTPLSEAGLLVADLATMHLDLAAAERGYLVG